MENKIKYNNTCIKMKIWYKYLVCETSQGDFALNTIEEVNAVVQDYGAEYTYIKKGKFIHDGEKWIDLSFKNNLIKDLKNTIMTIKCRLRNTFNVGLTNLRFTNFLARRDNNHLNRVTEYIQATGLNFTQDGWTKAEEEINKMVEEGRLTPFYEYVKDET